MRIAVLGAGIIGLWTAYELTNRGYEVVVYTDSPVTATTSSSAVAVVTPLFPWSLEEDPALFNESLGWYRSTLSEFQKLNEHGAFMSVIPSYEFGYVDQDGVPVLEKGFPASRLEQLNFTKVEILQIGTSVRVENETDEFDDVTFAVNFAADMVDTQVFLPFFEHLLRDRGVTFEAKHFDSVSDIERLPEEVMVNCLGMFSRFLFPEIGPEMYPIRGQSHFIRQDNEPPYFGVASGHHAVFRHRRGYYLGSYFLQGDSYTWRDETRERVESLQTLPTSVEWRLTKKFATENYPVLARHMGFNADPVPLESVWRVNTGIRPFRVKGPVSGIRHVGKKTILDNFGHGAHGWTIGYGSTVRALHEIERVMSDGQ